MSTSSPQNASSFVTRWSNLTPLGVLVTRCEMALAGLFLFAAYHKLWGSGAAQNFSDSVRAFQVVKGELPVRLATSVTPWVEVVASVLLLLGAWSRAAATVLGLMLIAFILMIANAIMQGYDLECGCFGELSPFCPKKVGWCNVRQNVILLALAAIIALVPRDKLARSIRAV